MRGRRYICTPFHPSKNINNNNHHHSEEPTLCSGEAATRRDPRFGSIVIIRFSHHHTPSDRVTLSQRSYHTPARFPFSSRKGSLLGFSRSPQSSSVESVHLPAARSTAPDLARVVVRGWRERERHRRRPTTVLETWGPSSVAQKPVGSSPL